jgi:hypothetical protein
MFCWPCITVYQYNETNVMHFLFSLLIIKGLYVFRALRVHLKEETHKRHLVHCVRVMSVGCTRFGVELVSKKQDPILSQLNQVHAFRALSLILSPSFRISHHIPLCTSPPYVHHGLDGQGIESRWGTRFSAPVYNGPGAQPASYAVSTGCSPGVDHAPHLAPRLEKEKSYTSIPRLDIRGLL